MIHVAISCLREPRRGLVLLSFSLLIACSSPQTPQIDHPRLTPAVKMWDVSFFSKVLQRTMPYRVVLPVDYKAGKKLPVIYLLHGGGENFRSWTNDSDVAQYAAYGIILVMPEGDSSYYVNSARNPQDRYEDYILRDLIADVEKRFPAAATRDQRAIVGVSMGGFGAIVLALKHPEVFAFAAGLSPALDVPSRPFSIKRVSQWRHHRSIFGDWNGGHQRENDPYELARARAADAASVPFIWFSCGDQEGLLPANVRFAQLFKERGFRFRFTKEHGGHSWNQWNPLLSGVIANALREMHATPAQLSSQISLH